LQSHEWGVFWDLCIDDHGLCDRHRKEAAFEDVVAERQVAASSLTNRTYGRSNTIRIVYSCRGLARYTDRAACACRDQFFHLCAVIQEMQPLQ